MHLVLCTRLPRWPSRGPELPSTAAGRLQCVITDDHDGRVSFGVGFNVVQSLLWAHGSFGCCVCVCLLVGLRPH